MDRLLFICALIGLLSPRVFGESAERVLTNRLSSVWEDVIKSAAQATLAEIDRSQGQETVPRVLEDVPLDTLQVFVGRSHVLAVEFDGISYEVQLGTESRPEPPGNAKQQAKKTTPRSEDEKNSGGAELVTQDWWDRTGDHRLSLPEVTLTGPLELVLPQRQPVSMFLPHAADVGLVQRVVLDTGATVRVAHMRSITLRRPVTLPNLPGQYLAEVYAHAKLGEPEMGFHYAPGILFMSQKLREMAENSTKNGRLPLLSFEIEPASHGSLSITSSEEGPQSSHGESAAPRLKIKKGNDATVELSVRPGQIAEPRLSLNSLTHVRAWPLSRHEMSDWLPYENLLRGIMSSHPFNMEKVVTQGIPLKLTKSSIKGVSMMTFEMHVRTRLEIPNIPEGSSLPRWETPLEVWEVMVQVGEEDDAKAAVSIRTDSEKKTKAAGFKYQPLSVKRKAVFGNTLTMSEGAVGRILYGNSTVPLGYESQDWGIARYN